MKIEHLPSVEAARHSAITLEGKREHALSDAQIIALLSDCAALHYDGLRDRYNVSDEWDTAMAARVRGEVRRDGDPVSVIVLDEPLH